MLSASVICDTSYIRRGMYHFLFFSLSRFQRAPRMVELGKMSHEPPPLPRRYERRGTIWHSCVLCHRCATATLNLDFFFLSTLQSCYLFGFILSEKVSLNNHLHDSDQRLLAAGSSLEQSLQSFVVILQSFYLLPSVFRVCFCFDCIFVSK